jgi:hypothetical protein
MNNMEVKQGKAILKMEGVHARVFLLMFVLGYNG